MIWNLENKVTHKIDTWYSKDTIDKIVKVCEEQNLKYDNVACEILNIIEESENDS